MEGQAVLLDQWDVVRAKRLPPDFQSWVQCFALYMAVVAQVHPHPDLLAYQCSIAWYSKKYLWPSWVIYDINFRQSKALTPGSSWAKTDGGFFTECFTSMRKDQGELWCRICHSTDHSSSSCPLPRCQGGLRQISLPRVSPQPSASILTQKDAPLKMQETVYLL